MFLLASQEVSCNEMCVSVCRSVGRSVAVFYLGVQMFCSETLSWSAFFDLPACIHIQYYCTVQQYMYTYTGGVGVYSSSRRLVVDTPHNSSLIVARRSPRRCSITRVWLCDAVTLCDDSLCV